MHKSFLKKSIFFLSLINFSFLQIFSDEFHKHNIVFPELSQNIKYETEHLNLTEEQLHLLTIIYETLLCRKIQKHHPFNNIVLLTIGMNKEKIENAFQKCKQHDHLSNFDHLQPFEKIPNKFWIPQKYFQSHGLTSEIVDKYQQVFHKTCKNEVFSKS